MIKLLTNENIPLSCVHLLKEMGYDVIHTGFEFPGVTDEDIIQFSELESRTIITFDRDYSDLIFKQGFKPSGGVIFLRINDYAPDELAKLLSDVLKMKEIRFSNMFTVIDNHGIRQRKF